ncbi:MAG: efflux RND transporter periplasmic adaptor subunit [Myxococcales bacterium]|nr:efflux RND transporter periplasmic adaptor subunit [Myxococcales bacterium]
MSKQDPMVNIVFPRTRFPWGCVGCWLLVSLAACTFSVGARVTEPADADLIEQEPKAAAVRVKVRRLVPRAFDDRLETTGSLEADSDVTLSARASGTLQFLSPLGEMVRKRQVVAKIDPGIPFSSVRQAQAARSAASASLALANENYTRQKPLYEAGVISAIEFQQINAEYAQAQARLAEAEAALLLAREGLENTMLIAPFAGVVDQHFVDKGEQVNGGTSVLRVLDATVLIVKAGLPERYAADIKQGAEVEVQFPAYGLEPRLGRVRFVATAIDPRSRTFDVEVSLNNQDGRLKPEMVAKLMVTRARIENALVVPQEAVIRDENGRHVFVVTRSTEELPIAKRRAVQTRGRAGGEVVLSGVSAGDEVIVLGQTKVIDGDFVEIVGSSQTSKTAEDGR